MSNLMAEFLGTMVLILLGDGVVAAVCLKKSKAESSGWIVITMGWALAVTLPVFMFGAISGAHFNPAVTIAFAVLGNFSWSLVPKYIAVQMLGAMAGATLVWLTYLAHWKETDDKATKLGIFATAPAIRNTTANIITEVIGTFMLVFVIIGLGQAKLQPEITTMAVGGLILALGLSLGGPTGYAINPARDLGPRIAHAILPIEGKGDSDWGYAWIPVVAPIIGGILGALVANSVF